MLESEFHTARAVRQIISEGGGMCYAAFEKLGIRGASIEPEHCGLYGCIFFIEEGRYEGRVAKITFDHEEAATATILHARRHYVPRMLPQLEAVFHLTCFTPSAGPHGEAYLIIREDLEDVPDEILNMDHPQYGEEVVRRIISKMSAALYGHERRVGTYDWLQEQLRFFPPPSFGKYKFNLRGNLLNAAAMLRWARDSTIFRDLHELNWGWRAATEELVIRDLGMSSSGLPHKTAETLSGLRRRR